MVETRSTLLLTGDWSMSGFERVLRYFAEPLRKLFYLMLFSVVNLNTCKPFIRKNGGYMYAKQLFIVFILVAGLQACHNMDEDWKKASQANTLEALSNFVDRYPTSPYANDARNRIGSLWATITIERPRCEILSDLSVRVTWPEVPGAKSYVVNWSTDSSSHSGHAHSETHTEERQFEHKLDKSDYGEQLTIYYRIAAIRDEGISKLSEVGQAQLLDDNNGTRCQICGKPAKGFCTMRRIYVCDDHNTFTDRSGTHWRCP